MADAAVVEQQIPKSPEANASKPPKPPEVKKTIGSQESEMAQKIEDDIKGPNPDPDKALREVVGEQEAESNKYKSVIEQVRQGSPKNLKEILDYYQIDKATLDREVAKVRETGEVTINMTWENIIKMLNEGRFRTRAEQDDIFGSAQYVEWMKSSLRRHEINIAEGDPHPVYGALASRNGVDEFYGGTGRRWTGRYGRSFITLRSENIKDRTTFTYGDTLVETRPKLDWEDAMVAKAVLNLGRGGATPYIEAQILGGVNVDDIQSIDLSLKGVEDREMALKEAEALREKFPKLKINIIEDPSEQEKVAA